ncbi:hypothetical protein BH20ACT9_BH20ACT9_12620 [soil metagenome]
MTGAGIDGTVGRMGRQPVERYRENLQDEVDSAAVYRGMADGEDSPQLADVYRRLAAAEDRHAVFWRERIERAGGTAPPPRPTRRARVLRWLAHRGGADLVLPTVAGTERRDQAMYDHQPEAAATSLPADERSHARLLRTLQAGGLSGADVARLEGRHRAVGGNALRAAVLGANDGLVSNLSLVMGVAGAALAQGAIVVTGLAGLLAGAASMALGEWVSVRSSAELAERQLRVESDEIAAFPQEEREELRLIYEAKGLSPALARAVADELARDERTALETMAREELGVDPAEPGSSPWVAAAVSFLLFAVGAIVPVAPFLVVTGTSAVVASAVASGAALFALGAAITLFTGRGAVRAGVRQVGIGLAAAAVTYGVGALLGVSLAG